MPNQGDDAIIQGLAEANRDEYEAEKKMTPTDSLDQHSLTAGQVDNDLPAPTKEDRLTLRRVSGRLNWNTYLIAYVELAERFSYYGTVIVFTNFIQQPLPPNSKTGAGGADGQSGALGMGQQASTGLTTFNSFWAYVTPLYGAYLADTYFGRFRTICGAIGVAIVGHILLIVSSLPPVIAHPHGALACFCIALVIMGAGTGGFKSNISPLIAEQYTLKTHVRTKKSGERVIVDPNMTYARIYMYFYLFINIGSLVGQLGMTYSEKYVGFWLAFLLPTIVFLTAPLVMLYGRNRYVRTPPQGSVLPASLRVFRTAAKGRWSWNPFTTIRNLKAPGFWDRAKPTNYVKEHGGSESVRPGWMTWDDKWVDEVRRGFKACEVFIWIPIYWLTYNQLNNNLTSQAATMSTHGLPNDVLSNLDPFALIIFIPICDLFIYPALVRYGIRFTPLKRITAGFFTGAAAMVWAAVVQHYIYKTNPCGYSAATCKDADGNALVSPLNVWIQTGSYVLIAFSEIFASITSLEYAFTKAPKNMRSVVMAINLFMSAISSALGEAFVSLSTDPLLVWNYGVMGVLAAVAGVGFWLTFRHLDADEERLNELNEEEGGDLVAERHVDENREKD
ncbi:PTR2-domain-containing protein [Fomitiporia mediterranea MF3/22]|uniref:PTR2-domain-containing protein n=1 Tax=Fomitiporia mediterranea (strain MF3/22) TaxID=694068 RepID=UPI0004407B5E|nr:PTR2-domain-containing protein [Fomitiporia mediterranea MF3/22]EJD04975.1 PTR2-domain-containing protein [Fomitiporia mediterranea MF3/22]